jgi:uncharacterized protein (TIGR01732 family)
MSAVAPTYGYRRGFALVVVLFILLIIIGASFVRPHYGGYYGYPC